MQNEINKTWIIYIIVWFFLGNFGIHRFISGKIGSGIGMLILLGIGTLLAIVLIGFVFLGALWIWWIVDGINIAMGNFEDGDGNKIPMKINGTENKN